MNKISSMAWKKEIISDRIAIRAFFVASFVMLTTLGAYVRIPLPFTPVPITLQTFFVILSGAILGRKLGPFTQFSYLALGAFGMPIFQGYGAGFGHLLGPTGGYLIGFILAAFITGFLIDKSERLARFQYIMLAMSFGLLSIFACGLAWLALFYRFGLAKAISLGFIPFIPGAIAKLIIASWIYSKIKSRTDVLIK